MQRYFIYLAYDGTNYHGWQIQPNGSSVQECLMKALSTFLRRDVEVIGAGRTDAGVHAPLMVAHFDQEEVLDTVTVADKLNRLLPPDISVYRIRRVKPDAHARFDATARTYKYYVTTAKYPFNRQYRCRVYGALDYDLMNEAARTLFEYIDFTSFSKLHTDVKTNICHISHAEWTKMEGEDTTWVFTIRADRFLRNMVRAIVGTLLEVGRGKLTVEGFRKVIEQRDRCKAGTSAPGNALFLVNVEYPEEILNTYFTMWLLLAFLSATLLGFYDVFKKQSLKDNAVLPVLFLNTLFSSLIFLPFILVSAFEPDILGGTIFNVPVAGWEQHKYIIIKSFIVLSSWIFGYFGMKHLPITIVGPINATRPVMVLVGAMLVFGERLNLYQWIGVMLAVASFFMLSRSGKKEGIDFKHNKWILFIVLAAVMGAISGLYDKFLMKQLNPMLVQSWYNVYQLFIMGTIVFLLWWPKRKSTTPFRWDWTIILISVFLSAADFVYFYALSYDDSMISIVSMVRRGSVIVSFIFGALFFREKNLKSKAIDLILVLIGMIFLYLGSK